MEKVYIVHVPKERLVNVTDMLRYDGCYEIKDSPDHLNWEISLTTYTPDRWRSFGVMPKLICDLQVKTTDFNRHLDQGIGFIRALRFAQKFYKNYGKLIHGTNLVEGT